QAGGYVLEFTLLQTQTGPAYDLHVPFAVVTEAGVKRYGLAAKESETRFSRQFDSRPLALSIDPDFDVFRLLDPLETPATIGQLFGASEVLAVLPSADPEQRDRYRKLIEGWQHAEHRIRCVLDSELTSWPEDKSVWVLGARNSWMGELANLAGGATLTSDGLVLGDESVPFAGHCLVSLWRNPRNNEQVIGLLTVDPVEAAPGLQTKLPHYGKYSYLAFEGAEPTNTVKGQWPTSQSPLFRDLRPAGAEPLAALAHEERQPLATLPPEFSQARMMRRVQWLADPARQGRGLASEGLAASAEYIAEAMAEIGLEPGGDNGTWFQDFPVAEGPGGQPTTARNVVGILRGTTWPEQSLLLTAHYDHLGMGWPDVHAGDENTLHPGADDNASGVAVMLELAQNLKASGPGARSLVVVAFSGEEAGLLGSRHYVAQPVLPLSGLRGVINLDTVGRLGAGKIAVHASGSADEWQHIFRGAGFVTGVPNQLVPQMSEGSDQVPFLEAGIPAVQLFTGAHTDYHRPGDTIDKVDARGLVSVCAFTKEAVTYMLDREEPLTVTIPGHGAAPVPAAGGGRRVSFGSMPDFGFGGPGVRLEGVTEGAPAALAGLQAGDIVLEIAGTEIDDLKGFSELLKTLQPDQTVDVLYTRDGKELDEGHRARPLIGCGGAPRARGNAPCATSRPGRSGTASDACLVGLFCCSHRQSPILVPSGSRPPQEPDRRLPWKITPMAMAVHGHQEKEERGEERFHRGSISRASAPPGTPTPGLCRPAANGPTTSPYCPP
ncbi:MAG: M20/M25/M40 family metallo-hydrolase, partial [Planctomycetota bacterium]